MIEMLDAAHWSSYRSFVLKISAVSVDVEWTIAVEVANENRALAVVQFDCDFASESFAAASWRIGCLRAFF